jgi:phage terminase large subunit-like protein
MAAVERADPRLVAARRVARGAGWDWRRIRTRQDVAAVELGCWWDKDAAREAVHFIETYCRHYEGDFAGQLFLLAGWQRRIVEDVFGWKRPDGTRRIRVVYIEVPRKNGKSTFCAALALLMLVGDGEWGARVCGAAVDRDQAREVFDHAKAMVYQSPELQEVLQVFRNTVRGSERSGVSASRP